jgi:hypothetical protein
MHQRVTTHHKQQTFTLHATADKAFTNKFQDYGTTNSAVKAWQVTTAACTSVSRFKQQAVQSSHPACAIDDLGGLPHTVHQWLGCQGWACWVG